MSAKTYVVTFYFGEGDGTALNFESFAEAEDYIHEATRIISDLTANKMISVSWFSENHCRFSINNGFSELTDAFIREYPSNAVRFDLAHFKNGKLVATRRYTKRELAVKRAHKILDDLGYEAEEREDDWGVWQVGGSEADPETCIALSLVILDQPDRKRRHKSDHELLGVNADASSDEIKQAYREMAFKHHPDQGGDSDKFQEVHAAYKRLIEAASASGSRQKSEHRAILKMYICADVHYFFRQMREQYQSIRAERRPKAFAAMAVGGICALIGLCLWSILPIFGILITAIGVHIFSSGCKMLSP